jgi:hypothetical protein
MAFDFRLQIFPYIDIDMIVTLGSESVYSVYLCYISVSYLLCSTLYQGREGECSTAAPVSVARSLGDYATSRGCLLSSVLDSYIRLPVHGRLS